MSQCAVCCKHFGPNGCQVPVRRETGNVETCGETQTLDIIREIKHEFEKKMKQIDTEAGGDCLSGLQAKLHLQQEWIKNLTAQNEMLVDAVKELEVEATKRVLKLEEKLESCSQKGSEVMQKYRHFSYSLNLDEIFQKLAYLQSDIKNLLEFIKRVRREGRWSIDGLQFYDVTYQDLFGSCECKAGSLDASEDADKAFLSVCPDQDPITSIHFEDEWQQKDQELEEVKKSMVDMRNALTVEVAEKHDIILSLRRDVQQLEEYVRQSNQHSHFKDEIIKELRKEIKILKGENVCENLEKKNSQDDVLTDDFNVNENVLSCQKPGKVLLDVCVNSDIETKKSSNDVFCDERTLILEQELNKALEEREIERKRRNQEVNNLKETITELEKALKNAQGRLENLQTTVDLYENSINLLEASEERSKIEKSQQLITIVNLQESLVTVKQRLDDLQLKTNSELEKDMQRMYKLQDKILWLKRECAFLQMKKQTLSKQVERMQDQILDLEVENFGYIQDIEIMEMRLSKYQKFSKNHQECGAMREEIAKLRAENEHQSNLNMAITQKLVSLESELEASSCAAAHCEELKNTVYQLQQAKQQLEVNLDTVHKNLMQETRINEIDAERIEELSHLVDKKTDDLCALENQFMCIQKNLEGALSENNELRNEVAILSNRIACYDQETILSEERTDYCQKEMDTCNKNLCLLKEKLHMLKELLHQKDEQYAQLETYFHVQTGTLETSKKICEETKAHYESDIVDLKRTIQELNNKLQKVENNYHALHEDYKKSQILVIDASHRESKMQQDFARSLQEFSEKLQNSEAEESRVRDYARQLETQNNVLRNDLMTLQRQIELLKAQIARLKSSASAQVKSAQEEVNNLKNDLNKIIQQHGKLKSENDSLRAQISHIQAYEQQNRVTGDQLDQCLRELHGVQAEKQRLEAMNQKCVKEFKSLQEAYKNMDKDHQRLLQSVIIIEHNLAVAKSSQDEICLEGQNVINNVYNWLHCQTVINDQLKIKLKESNVLINKLEDHISYLENGDSCKCCPFKERQRGGSSRHTSVGVKHTHKPPNLDLQATPTPSSTLTNTTNDWYTYTDSEDESVQEVDLPRLWVRKVKSITQELQKSNEYWQSQLTEDDYMVTRDQ